MDEIELKDTELFKYLNKDGGETAMEVGCSNIKE